MLFRRRSARTRRIVLVVSLGVVALIGYGAASAWAAIGDLREARALLVSAEQQARDLAFDEARSSLTRVRDQLTSATRRLGVLPLRVAARAPYLGRTIRAAEDLTAAASAATDGAATALRAADLLPVGERFSLRDGRIPAVDWDAVAELSRRAATALRRSRTLAERAPSSFVPGVIVEARARLLDEVEIALVTADRLSEGARILPAMLGEGGVARHLIVIQNGAEARATGGAIEGVMLLEARDRALDLIRSDPDELALGTAGDRDRAHRLNLEPNYPDAAASIATTYEDELGIRPDTVIATDSDGLAAILRITGPIRVDGRRLTGRNLTAFLSRDIFVHYPTEAGQGLVLARTSAAMWQRLKQGRFPMRAMVGQLSAAARAKHFLVWARDPQQQRALARIGVTGAVPPEPRSGAVLVVAGNNAGLAELDFWARRTWTYEVSIDRDGRAREQLDLALSNRARLSDIPPAVLRKQPKGILIHEARVRGGGMELLERLDVPPGQRRRLRATGSFATTPGEFRLRVFRQPGLYADDAVITLRLPNGAEVLESSPGLERDGDALVWSGMVDRDVELLVRYR